MITLILFYKNASIRTVGGRFLANIKNVAMVAFSAKRSYFAKKAKNEKKNLK